MAKTIRRLIVLVSLAVIGWLVPVDATALPASAMPTIESFELSSTDMYPAVKDDFKDEVEFDWHSNDTSPGQVDVISPAGVVLASFGDRFGSGGGSWNGKDAAGDAVGIGTYTFRLTVTNTEDGSSATSSRLLEVKSDVVSKKLKVHVLGHKADRKAHSVRCSVGRFGIAVDLDCNGGSYAQAQFIFKVPKDARDFKVRYDDFFTGASPGRYIRGGERVRPTRFVVTVRVTGYYSVILDAVDVSYTAKVPR